MDPYLITAAISRRRSSRSQLRWPELSGVPYSNIIFLHRVVFADLGLVVFTGKQLWELKNEMLTVASPRVMPEVSLEANSDLCNNRPQKQILNHALFSTKGM